MARLRRVVGSHPSVAKVVAVEAVEAIVVRAASKELDGEAIVVLAQEGRMSVG